MTRAIKAFTVTTCRKRSYEQPNAIKNTLTGRISHGQVDLSELGPNADELLSKVDVSQILACGTSYNSGMVSRYWFESLAGIPCDVEITFNSAIANLPCVVTA